MSSINPIPEQPYSNDEIDLLELFQRIWEGKLTILAAMLIAAIGAAGFLKATTATLTATLELKPITKTDAAKYETLNELGWYEVISEPRNANNANKTVLLERVIDIIEDGHIQESLLKQYDIPAKAEYETDADYRMALLGVISEIQLLAPEAPDSKKKGELREHWELSYEGKALNDEQITQLFGDLITQATNESKAFLINDFQRKIALKKRTDQYTLEDLKLSLQNTYADYDKKIKQRIALLKENAAIARNLGIERATIEAQTYQTSNALVANVQTDRPLYLRGYKALEREVELIQSRDNKQDFVSERIAIEAKIREIEQDKTLERNQLAFAKTPLTSEGEFVAVRYNLADIEFKSSKKALLTLALAVVLGGFIGMIVVLIRGAIQARKAAA